VFSFPPFESKLLGGKCLTYIDTEGNGDKSKAKKGPVKKAVKKPAAAPKKK
jgi:hypothetical protein